jgi:DNA-binding NarL/FixJ family response regulator
MTSAPYRCPMQPEVTRLGDGERDVDAWWLPSLNALEAGLARLHQHLALVDRELRQTRADYRRLLELNRGQVHNPLQHVSAFERLTQQERRVATLAAHGCSNLEVAAQLHVTVHTVKSQMGSILRKLDLRSRWELEHVLRTERRSFEG